jgi:hypothetical protein
MTAIMEDAVKDAVRRLLFQWDSIEKHGKIEDALKYSIGLGHGFTIGIPGQRVFGEYWCVWAYPNFTMKLLVGHGDDLRVEKVSRKEVITIATQIWTKEKQGQLSLFD